MEWTAMEINPVILNKIMHKLGVRGDWCFVDILDLDDDNLSKVPKPCCALMLLFPLTPKHKTFRDEQADRVSGNSPVYFLKQTTSNSCGTIALLHAVANNKAKMSFDSSSVLKTFLDETANMSPDDRAKHLEGNKEIKEAHNEAAKEGQCRPDASEVNFHFIAFVNVDDQLYEFDGMMNGPIKHGETKEESFVADAAKVCREFMKREEGELRFSAVGLCSS